MQYHNRNRIIGFHFIFETPALFQLHLCNMIKQASEVTMNLYRDILPYDIKKVVPNVRVEKSGYYFVQRHKGDTFSHF